jgi:hypothetical protein
LIAIFEFICGLFFVADIQAVGASSIPGSLYAPVVLSFGCSSVECSVFLDNSCDPDLLITEETASQLNLTKLREISSRVGGYSHVKYMFTDEPIQVKFSVVVIVGGLSVRIFNTSKVFVGGDKNIIGRRTLQGLRIQLPLSTDAYLVLPIDEVEALPMSLYKFHLS